MNEVTDWDDVIAMFEDICEHAKNNGRAVVNEDYPKELKLGWKCSNTNKVWKISIIKLKNSLQKADAKQKDFISRLIITQAGKEVLTELLNSKP